MRFQQAMYPEAVATGFLHDNDRHRATASLLSALAQAVEHRE